MTRLCVPIFVTDLAMARRDMAAAAAAGADLVELRIDKLEDMEVLEDLLGDKVCAAIVTCRPTSEGGFSTLGDEARAARLTGGVAAERADYVDLELATVLRHPTLLDRKIPAGIILSVHDLSAKPANLQDLVHQLDRRPAKVNKMVWQAQNIRENLDALNLLRNSRRPMIALCMGDAGLVSRILAKKFGAFLTFASLNAESATAPGQLTVADMITLYRWDALGPNTKVYGVVADPVRHSLSPAIHNAAFTAVGYDGIYLPMLVEPDYQSFKSFLEGFLKFPRMDLSGLSVTIPHKQNALRYLKETASAVEELAERIGAVNTMVIRRPDGSAPVLSGKNTDYAAILDSITAELQIDRDGLGDLRVAVLGAGGTGRAAVAALAHYGAAILVSNRTHDRAVALADEFNNRRGGITAVSFDELCRGDWDVFINTTSVGMYPNVDETPFWDRRPPFSAKTVVFDTVYNPMKTRLLTQAEGLGARTISGVEMFVRQAVAQFETWTGLPAPQAVMRRIIADRLGTPLHHK
jgi:3-dehydroquinate dehydratase/shikimate dehydrogenase